MTPDGSWVEEVGSALSRLLNALTGGDGSVTFSARSYDAMIDRPTRLNKARVAAIDWLHREPGHCRDAWTWHAQKGLV